MRRHQTRIVALVAALAAVSVVASAEDKPQPSRLKAASLGATKNVHAFGGCLLCGQPTAADFAEAKRRGIKCVLTLRQVGEINWDEPGTVKRLGMDFQRFAFGPPETLSDKIFAGSLKVLAKSGQTPVMLHCGSANRVGAIWLAHRVLNDGLSVEAARQEAKVVGLRTAGYEQKALDYIKREQTKKPEQSK